MDLVRKLYVRFIVTAIRQKRVTHHRDAVKVANAFCHIDALVDISTSKRYYKRTHQLIAIGIGIVVDVLPEVPAVHPR